MSQTKTLFLEAKRQYNETYQIDHTDYLNRIKQLQYILSVRARKDLKSQLLSTQVRIINRGKAEAFSRSRVIYFDISILDLLTHFSDEISLAEVKSDVYHQLEFNLAYAAALNGNKKLEALDPHNTASYTKEQNLYRWKDKLRSEQVIFDNILGFILAHEFSHIALNHDHVLNKEFPEERLRNSDNAEWNQRRREMELEADEMGARLCLQSLIQPAQLIPWLDLNEIRRRYYGKAAEYPTTAQRIAVIQKAYVNIVGADVTGGDLRDFNPLSPHRDVTQIDYNLFLDEFRKVRAFRQSFLIEIDQTLNSFLKDKFPLDEIAAAIFVFVERQKDLLRGARNSTALNEVIKLVSSTADQKEINIETVKLLIEKAGIGEYGQAMLIEQLEQNPINWNTIISNLDLLKAAPGQFYDGVQYDYLLANTYFRWYPDLFAALQAVLPKNEVRAKRLKPYRLDQPIRQPLPTYDQKLEILKTWNGKYHDS